MPCGIHILEWIVADVGVAIIRLEVFGIGDHRIRLDEPCEDGIIVPGFVIIEPGVDVIELACVTGIEFEVGI